jgi:hypothetical protein
MKNLFLLVGLAVVVLPTQSWAEPTTQVTLRIEGIHQKEDGVAVATALSQVPNIKVATFPTPENPTVILVPLDGAKYDLGDLAHAITGAKTPNRGKGAPSAALLLTYKADDAQAVLLMAKDLDTICAKLKGVAAKGCKLDTEKRELQIKLDDLGGATLAQIRTAFPKLDSEYYPKR